MAILPKKSGRIAFCIVVVLDGAIFTFLTQKISPLKM